MLYTTRRNALGAAALASLFEAARWAPSSYNSQPWRFVYARRDTPAWQKFLGLMVEFNQGWAKDAAVLIIAISKTTMTLPNGQVVPSHSASFDTGAAWENLALQATLNGWHAHGMIGLDLARAATELSIPDGYRVEAAIAVGRKGDKSSLSETLQARETPSPRAPVASFAFEGNFAA